MDNRVKTLIADVQDVLDQHPELSAVYDREVPVRIKGTYVVRDDRGIPQGSFEIKVLIPKGYPYGFPMLFEISENIERTIDRHIFANGLTCEEIIQKKRIIAARGITIKQYFDQYVHKFFCWQLIYEEEGNKNLQEWPHRGDGVVQFYMEHLQLADRSIVEQCIGLLAQNRIPGRNAFCPCGSGKKLKRCHEEALNDLKIIGKQQLKADHALFVAQSAASL